MAGPLTGCERRGGRSDTLFGLGGALCARRRAPGLAGILVAGALAAACASSGATTDADRNTDPPEVTYSAADALLDEGQFFDAAEKFEEVDRDHPYAPEARRALVMSAYAYYRAARYPEALSAAERYITLHPGTSEAALAHNIMALAEFDQIQDPKRDQTRTRKALDALETVQRRYPDSRYAEESQSRINAARDVLAASEMNVGRYYLERHNYLAAINRFRVVVTDYQTTVQVEEALMRLTEAYMALGIVQEAQTAAAVLGHNFPDSEWYQHAFKLLQTKGLEPHYSEGSWMTRTLRRLSPI